MGVATTGSESGADLELVRVTKEFGTFTAVYGACWFAGSALIGWIYDHGVTGAVVFCIATQAAAIPIFVWVSRRA